MDEDDNETDEEEIPNEVITFGGIADGMFDWDEIIQTLQNAIKKLEQLKKERYIILANHDDYIIITKEN